VSLLFSLIASACLRQVSFIFLNLDCGCAAHQIISGFVPGFKELKPERRKKIKSVVTRSRRENKKK
jgi:hypothetical protein